jgi:hypothetical protein
VRARSKRHWQPGMFGQCFADHSLGAFDVALRCQQHAAAPGPDRQHRSSVQPARVAFQRRDHRLGLVEPPDRDHRLHGVGNEPGLDDLHAAETVEIRNQRVKVVERPFMVAHRHGSKRFPRPSTRPRRYMRPSEPRGLSSALPSSASRRSCRHRARPRCWSRPRPCRCCCSTAVPSMSTGGRSSWFAPCTAATASHSKLA